MTSAAKAKGSAWERAVKAYFREKGWPAYKPHEEGFVDVGDLHVGPAVVQAKDWRSWESAIREGLDGAVRQAHAWDVAINSRSTTKSLGRFVPVAVVKRARKPVGEAYAVMRLEDFDRLLRRAYRP